MKTAGLEDVRVLGLEGPAGLALEARGTQDDNLYEPALTIARQLGDIPGIRDLSNHLVGIGQVPHTRTDCG
jgi:hypothetical protein